MFSGVWQLKADMAVSGFGHFGLDERWSLFRLQEARVPVAEIASRLGRHRSTIHRELARNRYRNRKDAGALATANACALLRCAPGWRWPSLT